LPEARGDDPALGVTFDYHLRRIEILFLAFLSEAVIGLGYHHALGEQAGERLIALDQTQIAHELMKKAGIEEMHDRMLDAADVLIHR
jgi:hypothetical protein